MGAIYQQHPKHGIHVATTEEEAAANRLNGWSDWTPGDPAPVSPNPPIPDAKAIAKAQESEVEVLKAQMAALLKRLDAAEAKDDEPKPAKKAAAPAVPDFLKGDPKP